MSQALLAFEIFFVVVSISSSHGVMYVIGSWLDKIEKERKEVQKWFNKLEFLSANLKPRSVLDPNSQQQIDALVKAAFDCHLEKEEETEKVNGIYNVPSELFFTTSYLKKKKQKAPEKKKRSLCLLCQVKQVLLKYECLIFDKTFVDDIDRENLGSWNPSFQEAMLRGMCAI